MATSVSKNSVGCSNDKHIVLTLSQTELLCITQEAVTKTGHLFGRIYVKRSAGKMSFGNRMSQTLERKVA